MKLYQAAFLIASVLVFSTEIDAKKRKHKEDSRKTKTKTKWSTTTDLDTANVNTMIAAEEHGYYVKRSYLPINSTIRNLQSPPYLGIPIAWFSCEDANNCRKSNVGAVNSPSNALTEGFLCDDDCVDPYEPICGKTPYEVAVFYNKCKLNVAKCRTHGLWLDLPYEECAQSYPKETAYANKKFRASPFFKEVNAAAAMPIAVAPTAQPATPETAATEQVKESAEPVLAAADKQLQQAKLPDALDKAAANLSQVEEAEKNSKEHQNVKVPSDRFKYEIKN